MPSLKIALAIPCYGNPEALFMQSLTAAISHFYESKLTTEAGEAYDKQICPFIVQSSMLTESRHRLVAEALNWGADYMLWLDADHVFAKETICRLWARNVQIVGCNYPRRCKPTAPTAAKIISDDPADDHENLVYTTEAKAKADLIEPVSHLGFGVCLMRMDVFDLLQLQAEKDGKATSLPLFLFTPNDNHQGMIGEDVYFFKKCREAGIPVHLDHAASWDVGHITSIILTNQHAVSQEEIWLEEITKQRAKYDARIAELEGAQEAQAA